MIHKRYVLDYAYLNHQVMMKTKKAVIVISLVEESKEIPNEEIEKEIKEELSKDLPRIPWFKKIEKVTVRET